MSESSLGRLKENRCAEPDCYHYTTKGYVYCNHHLYGGCSDTETNDFLNKNEKMLDVYAKKWKEELLQKLKSLKRE